MLCSMRQRLALGGRRGISGLQLKFSSSVATPKAPLFVQGKFVQSETTEYIDVFNPATNNVTLRVPQATQSELEAAVRSAKEAFPKWRGTPITQRQRIMFQFLNLLHDHTDNRIYAALFVSSW